MEARPASRTAVSVGRQRAAHQILDGKPKICDDKIIVGLVPDTTESSIRAAEASLQEEPRRRARANFVLRSRFAEDLLEAAVMSGIRQYAILGAGLDTFGYRQPSWASDLVIVEIDHPESQVFKRECLKAAGVSLPRNVHFVPVDFERESLAERFSDLPFDLNASAFFSWLGVTQYLERSALLTTLKTIASWPGGSQLVLTYIHDDWSALDEISRAAMETAEAFSRNAGEPWLTRLSEAAMSDLLRTAGFGKFDHLSMSEARRRYFQNREDRMDPAGGIGLVHAWT